MPVRITCPNGHTLSIRDEHIGKRVRCPTCKTIIVAPGPQGPLEALPVDLPAWRVGSPTYRLPPPRAAADSSDDSADEEEPETDRSRLPIVLFFVIGGIAVVLLAVAGILAWRFLLPPEQPATARAPENTPPLQAPAEDPTRPPPPPSRTRPSPRGPSTPPSEPAPPRVEGPHPATLFPETIAYWGFDDADEANATAADVTGHGHEGALHGILRTSGQRGSALEFDGSGGFFDYGSSPAFNFAADAPFTLAGWVQTTDAHGSVVSQRSQSNAAPMIDITISEGKLAASVRAVGNPADPEARLEGKPVNDGDWHHFALTREVAGKLTLFIDGELQPQMTSPQARGAITTDLRALGSERYWVKNGGGPGRASFRGSIDEFCILRRALNAQEIRKLAGLAND